MSAMRHWRWVPSLYFAEGIPYAVVGTVSVVMLKNFGLSNAALAFWSSLLTLPWVLKPLWAPVIDLFGTKKRWIVVLQILMGAAFAAAALVLPLQLADQLFIALLLLVAFASATHDAAADGFYLIGLDAHDQAFFTGIRSTAYRAAMITAQGGLVMLAGYVAECRGGDFRFGWMVSLGAAAALFGALAAWHLVNIPAVERVESRDAKPWTELLEAFSSFFRKPHVGRALAFLLLYRLGESQLVRLAAPFMLDEPSAGGIGLSTVEQGFFYGSLGVAALLAGGVLGGLAIAAGGIRRWMWAMALAINVPDLLYVYLAHWQPQSRWMIGGSIAVEQFGYGFGFTLYMLYMVAFAGDSGKYRTSHFALMTGFMALGMLLPGMAAGRIQEWIGSYPGFFWFVILCTLPGFWVTWYAMRAIPADFGLKRKPDGAQN